MAQRLKAIEDLLRESKTGRNLEGTFHTIFTLYYPQVCRFFLRRGLDQEDAKDLAQDVFFSVFQGLENIQDEAHFTSWMFTIARNKFVNELEKRYARKRSGVRVDLSNDSGEQDMDDFPAKAGNDGLGVILDREKTRKLADALETLPPQMRRCVQLRVASDASYEEIAAVMGISVNTVKVHLHKARKSLQEKLSSYFSNSAILSRESG